MARFFALGALLLLPVLVASGGGGLGSPGGLALVVYLAAIPTALAYVLFARGLRRLTSGETATLTLAEPLTATVLGTLVLAERPGLLAVAGAALVLAGLAAEGTTEVSDVAHIDRGYEGFVASLVRLGADVRREPAPDDAF